MPTLIGVVLVAMGVGLCLLGGYATVKRFGNPTSTALPGIGTVSLPESIVIIILGLAAITGAGVVPSMLRDGSTVRGGRPGPSPSPTAATPSTDPSSPTTGSVVTITEPPNGFQISGREGATIKGTATNLATDETVWLLDHDPADNNTPYYQTNDQPLVVTGGTWSFTDAPVGDDSDPIGTKLYVVAVKAGPNCTRAFKAARPNAEGDVAFAKLADDCYLTAPRLLIKARQ